MGGESTLDIPAGDGGRVIVRVVVDIEALARQIAVRMDPQALMDAKDVAAYLKCSARYVLHHYTLAPGFPKAIRLEGPNRRRSNPRWQRADILVWIESQRVPPRRAGRPRNKL